MQKDKRFYIQALNTEGQNCFKDYLFEETYKLAEAHTQEILGSRKIDEALMNLISEYFAHAFTGVTIDWVKKGMTMSPEKLKDYLVIMADRSNIDIVENNIISQESPCKA